MNEMEKVEMLIDFFASIFTGKLYSQARWVAEPCDRGCGNETLPRAAGERGREYLSRLNIHLWEQMQCWQSSPRLMWGCCRLKSYSNDGRFVTAGKRQTSHRLQDSQRGRPRKLQDSKLLHWILFSSHITWCRTKWVSKWWHLCYVGGRYVCEN